MGYVFFMALESYGLVTLPSHDPRGLVVQLLTLRGQRLRVTDRLPAMAVMKSRLHHASEHAETGITSSL